MESGIHFAEFYIVGGHPWIGIVRPMPNLDPARFFREPDFGLFEQNLYSDFLEQRSDEWSGTVHACEYGCGDGVMSCTDWENRANDEFVDEWDGMGDCKTGDTVGMLLNLDEGTLTVYKNNRRLGVIKDGLSGSYCWHGSIFELSAISIKRSDARNAYLVDEVIKVIRNLSTESRNELGVHINAIVGQASQKGFSERDIRNAISFLYKKGHIYTTIDEDHYLSFE